MTRVRKERESELPPCWLLILVDKPISEFDEFLLEFGRYPLRGGIPIEFSDPGIFAATFHLDSEVCDTGFREGSNERYRYRHRLHPIGIGTDVLDGSFEMPDVCL